MTEELPHSAIYFGDARDHWWNADFIALCAQRVGLGRFRRVLDVGTGYGHWSRVLLPHFGAGTHLTGIDPEARSVAEAAARTRGFIAEKGLSVTTDWQKCAVEQLPFPDGAFDLVTAQTVLIHVRDVSAAIAEMARVLAPGGLLLLAEPNNLAGMSATLIHRPDADPERTLLLHELELRIQRGKFLLGEGYNSAGEYLARHLDAARFTDVRGWLCDRPYAWIPPYASRAQQDEIAELRDFHAKGWYGRPPEEALRYYLAGGGDEARFHAAYAAGLAMEGARLAEIDQGTFVIAGGHIFHLVAATRRS